MRALVIALALALVTAPAAADDRATAEKHFRTGERLFGAGDFVHAAGSFELAYATLPLPGIAFSAAQAYRLAWAKAGARDPAHLRRAVELYRVYVEKEPGGDRVVEASAALADLEPLMARLGGGVVGAAAAIPQLSGMTVTSAVPGVEVAIDGAAPARLPMVKEVAAGGHNLIARAAGYAERTLSVTTLDGVLLPVEIELDPLPARLMVKVESGSALAIDGRAAEIDRSGATAVPAGRHLVTVTRRGRHGFAQEIDVGRGQELTIAARQPVSGQRRAARWLLFGAAGLAAGAGVAAGFALAADGDAAELADRLATRGLSIDELDHYQELRRQRDERRTFALGLTGAAVAVGLTGGLLYWFDRDEPGRLPTLTPAVTADGAALTATGRF